MISDFQDPGCLAFLPELYLDGLGSRLDLGKRVQRWGKGYAWSPTGFVERQKDPSDPLLAREGFEMASVEWSKRFETDSADGLSSIALTGLVLPTSDHLNTDFGSKKSSNPAARLYLLAFDTDIDLMWRGKGARPESYGFDFSRNLNPALEVHGEWARTVDATRNLGLRRRKCRAGRCISVPPV